MRTIKAVLSGFLVASALILAAGWAYGLLAAPQMRGEYKSSLFTALLALVYTSASIVAGAYVASRIHDSSETTGGFVVAQAFFGFGLIREFWSTGSSWYTVAAVLLVIPCAFMGRALARRFGRASIARAA
jgi:Ca2+/H+ antiporter